MPEDSVRNGLDSLLELLTRRVSAVSLTGSLICFAVVAVNAAVALGAAFTHTIADTWLMAPAFAAGLVAVDCGICFCTEGVLSGPRILRGRYWRRLERTAVWLAGAAAAAAAVLLAPSAMSTSAARLAAAVDIPALAIIAVVEFRVWWFLPGWGRRYLAEGTEPRR